MPGAGPERFINGREAMPYAIFFENVETATAPAQEVNITDQLDASKLNLDTFELGPISFGQNTLITPPSGLSEWTTDVDLRPDNNLIVRVIAGLDQTTSRVSWHFFSLDPATMQPTEDPLAGFLPPNQTAPEGDGAVTFSVDPYPNQPFGTQIANQATIIFDSNAPINTPIWINTIDDSPPASAVLALNPTQNSRRFQVSWSGSDSAAGVANYSIYVSENGGPYSLWLNKADTTTAIYDGRPNASYAFYSIAEDRAGNLEELPSSADATTTTADSPPVQLTQVTSVKVHGTAGLLGIDLPLTGNPGIECRSGGVNGDYTLVFTFSNPLTRVDGVSLAVPEMFNSSGIAGNHHQYFVNLTGVASGQYLEVTLMGVGDEAGNYSDAVQTTVGVLVGDTTANGQVNSSDVTDTKAQSGAAVSQANCRQDVTLNGSINSTDVALVKSRSGTALPILSQQISQQNFWGWR